ncbi:MAG TPA: signal peptidase II [Candidatus Hydrogenedens sp.]|nr:signal peptidase II [Candidatus Hydrogenedens sp.]
MKFHFSKYHILILALLIIMIIFDQVTKIAAIKYLRGRPSIHFPESWAPHDLFRFTYAENTGAFLSLGSQLPDSLRFWLFIVLNSVVLLILLILIFYKENLPLITMISFTLIISGGVGNIIDRVFRDGKVIDFMNMGIGFGSFSLRTGIFNVADLAIVFGLVLLILGEFIVFGTANPG